MKSTVGTERKTIVFGEDSVVIQKFNGGIKGGRTLDTTGITDKYLYAGRVIITNGNGTFKPLGITGTTTEGVTTYAYDAVPNGYSVCGILYRTIETARAEASIMFDGEVNEVAAAIKIPAPYTSAIKSALPNVTFIKDEIA